MKMLKSIKWRLQIWYGLILVAVLAGFGFTAYQLERGRVFRRVDEELQRRIAVIGDARRVQVRGQARSGGVQDIPPGRRPARDQNPDNPPRAQPPGPPLPGWEGRPMRPEELLAWLPRSNLFDQSDTNGFYYIVQTPDGTDLLRSANAPAASPFSSRRDIRGPGVSISEEGGLRLAPPRRQPPSTTGNFRETIGYRPGFVFVVGCSIAPEWKELRHTAVKLSGVGAAILLLGLAGGWWIASRAMQPIQGISTAATRISAGDLSQRINIADAESELGQLASTLNSTFSRLESAFGQQRQFTADAAHELRTPLAVILSETQATLKRERSAEEYRQAVEVCQRITQRMRRLIESLMELARLDAGQEQLKQMKFDLSTTAVDCVELVRPLADERNVKILSEVSSLSCVGDRERISQVVTNLLTNAVEHNRSGGEVKLSVQREGGLAVLCVSDTGSGISAEDLPHIFERFYRAEKSRSSGNAGLGLAISKAIIEGHGGSIEVSSQPDQGATFTVRLPTDRSEG